MAEKLNTDNVPASARTLQDIGLVAGLYFCCETLIMDAVGAWCNRLTVEAVF